MHNENTITNPNNQFKHQIEATTTTIGGVGGRDLLFVIAFQYRQVTNPFEIGHHRKCAQRPRIYLVVMEFWSFPDIQIDPHQHSADSLLILIITDNKPIYPIRTLWPNVEMVQNPMKCCLVVRTTNRLFGFYLTTNDEELNLIGTK